METLREYPFRGLSPFWYDDITKIFSMLKYTIVKQQGQHFLVFVHKVI